LRGLRGLRGFLHPNSPTTGALGDPGSLRKTNLNDLFAR
jgi:hypothetical protein